MDQPNDRTRSWWRSAFVGYPLALAFVGGAFLVLLLGSSLGIQIYFVDLPFMIATFFVGWIWGIGPALFALLVAVLVIDYWVIPPLHNFTFFQWPYVASFLLFIALQLLIVFLIAVLRHRQQLLLARQTAARHAEELAKANQALAESNAQLEQADRFKDQFLSHASHELKTPITTIVGQAQLALRRLSRQQALPADFAFLPSHLEKVEIQAHRLHALVDDLLNLSSLRSGRIPLRVASCDLSSLCLILVEEQRELTKRCIDLERPMHPLMIQADEGRLSQVISNLLTNAIKYSPANTVIRVEVRQTQTHAIFSVHNDGSVLSQDQQHAIFEPFYRTPEAQSSATQGWGLGLAISKEIVEQHHGRLWVESSEGEGTTFFVELPISTEEQ
ncbi:MAG TPA: HAMP domain-containing sensor histidine kinase [Ktedonobacteraceae bacterium]|nr:HAMP domain-containing sensor histidine kinase [Ktedonobacteraceae bacterium]